MQIYMLTCLHAYIHTYMHIRNEVRSKRGYHNSGYSRLKFYATFFDKHWNMLFQSLSKKAASNFNRE